MQTEVTCGSPLILYDQEMEQAATVQFLGGRVAYFSTRSPGKTTANEDAAGLVSYDDTSGALVVADGMGGHAAGEVASRLAVETVVQAVQEAAKNQSLLRNGIINGFERANQMVRDLANGAGTTLAVVEIADNSVRPYHVGDSFVLVVGNRGKRKLQTISHSPVGLGIEAGLLDDDEATTHSDRHLILNAIGTESMRIEIGPTTRLSPRDSILVASDGLADNLTVDEIVEHIRKGKLPRALRKLISACQTQMTADTTTAHPDDLTLLLHRGS